MESGEQLGLLHLGGEYVNDGFRVDHWHDVKMQVIVQWELGQSKQDKDNH